MRKRICYYIVRDVVRGSNCSYPAGRTLLNCGPVFTDPDAARRTVEVYNAHCHVPGVCYHAIGHPETDRFPADHYEQE